MSDLSLYTYCRSSAAYRVRIALNYKGVPYAPEFIHLAADGGQHRQSSYLAMNPQGLVPLLKDGDFLLNQSLAIIEYIDECYPSPPLLPKDRKMRAQARALALTVACDIHPLNNLRVLKYLRDAFDMDDERKLLWYQHWIADGFAALEHRLATEVGGPYCLGSALSIADVVLVPQVYNAKRFHCPLDKFPRIQSIFGACMDLKAFQDASPESQKDFTEVIAK